MQCTNIGENIDQRILFFDGNFFFCLARPCCTGLHGDCVLTSKDDCRRRRGIYHPRAHLCSQV